MFCHVIGSRYTASLVNDQNADSFSLWEVSMLLNVNILILICLYQVANVSLVYT